MEDNIEVDDDIDNDKYEVQSVEFLSGTLLNNLM